MSTTLRVHSEVTPLMRDKVLLKHALVLAQFLFRAKRKQQIDAQHAREHAIERDREQSKSKRYRLARKVLPGVVMPVTPEQPPESPLEMRTIALHPSVVEIARLMSYDKRVTLLLVEACVRELLYIGLSPTPVTLESVAQLQAAIRKFIRMYPKPFVGK